MSAPTPALHSPLIDSDSYHLLSEDGRDVCAPTQGSYPHYAADGTRRTLAEEEYLHWCSTNAYNELRERWLQRDYTTEEEAQQLDYELDEWKGYLHYVSQQISNWKHEIQYLCSTKIKNPYRWVTFTVAPEHYDETIIQHKIAIKLQQVFKDIHVESYYGCIEIGTDGRYHAHALLKYIKTPSTGLGKSYYEKKWGLGHCHLPKEGVEQTQESIDKINGYINKAPIQLFGAPITM